MHLIFVIPPPHLECYEHRQSPRFEKGRAPQILKRRGRIGEHVAVHVRHAGKAGAVGGVHGHLQDLVRDDKPDFGCCYCCYCCYCCCVSFASGHHGKGGVSFQSCFRSISATNTRYRYMDDSSDFVEGRWPNGCTTHQLKISGSQAVSYANTDQACANRMYTESTEFHSFELGFFSFTFSHQKPSAASSAKGLDVRNALHIGLELPTAKGASRRTYRYGPRYERAHVETTRAIARHGHSTKEA